jgi:hypothetical protein
MDVTKKKTRMLQLFGPRTSLLIGDRLQVFVFLGRNSVSWRSKKQSVAQVELVLG